MLGVRQDEGIGVSRLDLRGRQRLFQGVFERRRGWVQCLPLGLQIARRAGRVSSRGVGFIESQQDSDGGLIVIAASPATAARLAAAAVGSRLSVTVLAR